MNMASEQLNQRFFREFTDTLTGRVLKMQDMTAAHLEQICDLEKKIFPNPWPLEAFLSELYAPYSHSFVVLDGKRIAAYAVTWFLGEEFHLSNIAVDDKYRKRGIATWMLDNFLQMCRKAGIKIAHLEVRRSNLGAIKLYRKFGFHVTGVRKNYYETEHEDALMMSRLI